MSDASYFQDDLVERLRARARLVGSRLRALFAFHNAYQRALLGPDGKLTPQAAAMLRDLAGFCGADASPYHDDARRHALMEGRRQVWQRIERGLRLNHAKLEELKKQLEEENDDE
ncbi:MAG TPA: hypothetical protein VGB70_12755 [Allosphingosinicella sp.]